MSLKIIHFHNHNRIALTISSLEILWHPDIYIIGMALASKHDNGAKRIGKQLSYERLEEGLYDPDLEVHINEMLKNGEYIRGEKGHWIIFGKDTIINIIKNIRLNESYSGTNKLTSIYHNVFFRLNKFEREIC